MADPSARTGLSLALDSVRSKILLFGGHDDLAERADTWELDPSGWTEVVPEGDGPPVSIPFQYGPGQLVYDPAREKMVLTWGAVSTWEYDTVAWEEKENSGSPWPAPVGAAACYHAGLNKVLYHGGIYLNGFGSGRTSTWDGVSWEDHPEWGFVDFGINTGHCIAYDPFRGKVVLFGGNGVLNGAIFTSGQTWELDGAGWSQAAPLISPPARTQARMVFNPASGRLQLFGGKDENDQALQDLWEYDGNWTEIVQQATPQPRFAHGMTTFGDLTVVFGGSGSLLGDTWSWNGDIWIQGPPGTPPAITTSSPLLDGTVGTLYSGQLASTGTTPIVWSLVGGALPLGLGLASSGLLSGEPLQEGASLFQVSATNIVGVVSKQFSLTILPQSGPPPAGSPNARKFFIATVNQQTIDLAPMGYVPGSNDLFLFVNGQIQYIVINYNEDAGGALIRMTYAFKGGEEVLVLILSPAASMYLPAPVVFNQLPTLPAPGVLTLL